MTDVFFSAIKFGEMDFLRHYFFTQTIRHKVHLMFTYSTLFICSEYLSLKGTIWNCFYRFKSTITEKTSMSTFIILLDKTRFKNIDLQHCFQVLFSWRHSLNSIEFSLRSKIILDITGNSFSDCNNHLLVL